MNEKELIKFCEGNVVCSLSCYFCGKKNELILLPDGRWASDFVCSRCGKNIIKYILIKDGKIVPTRRTT